MLESLKTNSFEYKRLTEEEQKSRCILGRLVGVIADTKNPTRNGRAYSTQLWENVFNSDLMQEKIKNRCVLGELNHPVDRTEIDPEKVAICLAETPKKGSDGKLYGVFDILDTPNGRILKTLCDYGTIIGVSSRGQGDLVQDYEGNESVDPDTYECECWDAVLLPAVKEARMKYVKEGLDLRELKLKKALNESFNNASEEDKKIMKETLNNLHLNITEAKKAEEDEEVKENDSDEELEIIDDEADQQIEGNDESEETVESESEEEEVKEEADDEESEEAPELTLDTILSFIQDNFGKEAADKVEDIISTEVEDNDIDEEAVEDSIEDAEEEIENNEAEETEDETKEESEEAIDDGADDLVNSLKEALKDKSNLENDVKELQQKLAVSDTKVDELTEECDRCKKAITRLTALAKESKDLKEKVLTLEESLEENKKVINEQNDTLESQKVRIARLIETRKESINESVKSSEKDNEIKSLNEKLEKSKAELAEALEKQKSEKDVEIAKLNESITKVTSIKESYKKLANKAVNKYIEVKAMTLGLTSSDIKRKLGESYSMEDVDAVCEELKAYNLNVSKLPFNVGGPVRVKVNESNNRNIKKSPLCDDDEVDDTLIKLANI